MTIGVHTGFDKEKNLNVGTLISSKINRWKKQVIDDYAKHQFKDDVKK